MNAFTLKLTAFFLPLAVAMGVIIGIAIQSGEAMPLKMVIRNQEADPLAIYLPVDRDTIFAYKNLMYHERQPDVVVIGSSRVLNFRSNALNNAPEEFYNAGFSGMRMREIEAFIDTLTPGTAPKILVMGIDQFWFNTLWTDNREEAVIDTGEIGVERVLKTTRRAWQEILLGTIDLPQVFAARDPLYGGRAMGIDALVDGVGYLSDGSRQTDIVTLNPGGWFDLRQDSLNAYWQGRGHYRRGKLLNDEALEQLERIIQKAQALDITIIGFGPPFMPDIYNGMMSGDAYSYLTDLTPRLTELFEDYDVHYFEFADVSALSDNANREMADGVHASELMSLRIYLEMVKALPDILGEYTDIEALEALIADAPNPHEVYRQYAD
jgi:hypothetical protein